LFILICRFFWKRLISFFLLCKKHLKKARFIWGLADFYISEKNLSGVFKKTAADVHVETYWTSQDLQRIQRFFSFIIFWRSREHEHQHEKKNYFLIEKSINFRPLFFTVKRNRIFRDAQTSAEVKPLFCCSIEPKTIQRDLQRDSKVMRKTRANFFHHRTRRKNKINLFFLSFLSLFDSVSLFGDLKLKPFFIYESLIFFWRSGNPTLWLLWDFIEFCWWNNATFGEPGAKHGPTNWNLWKIELVSLYGFGRVWWEMKNCILSLALSGQVFWLPQFLIFWLWGAP
jgi:hypothetical protein